MTNEELLALTALVNHESQNYYAVNKDRIRDGYSLAYPDVSDNYLKLQRELKKRGCI